MVMGVAGSGKTTVARGIAERWGWVFADADDLHPPSNRAKMRNGIPLSDRDRWPWLLRVSDWMAEQHAAGRDSVVACSALRRSYRRMLGGDRPWVCFCLLDGSPELLASRLASRSGHFMPSSLLGSQLETLERFGPGEQGVTVDVRGTEEEVLRRALAALTQA